VTEEEALIALAFDMKNCLLCDAAAEAVSKEHENKESK
jgi:hypothetical protein